MSQVAPSALCFVLTLRDDLVASCSLVPDVTKVTRVIDGKFTRLTEGEPDIINVPQVIHTEPSVTKVVIKGEPVITKVTRVIKGEPSINKVTRIVEGQPSITTVTRVIEGEVQNF